MGVSRAYEVGSPYAGSQVSDIDFEQTADTMYIVHKDTPVTKLVRADHDEWSFETVAFGPTIDAPTGVAVAVSSPNQDAANDGNAYFPQPASYVVTAIADESDQESRASASASGTNDLTLKRNKNTVSWSAVSGAARYKVYKSNNSQAYGYIGTTESTSFVDDNIGPALDQAPPEGFNPFDSAGNYPHAVTLFEQRAMFGQTRNNPNAIWGSRSGQFENFDRSRPLRADDGLSLAIVAGRVNAVNQLVSTTSLLALTSDSIFKIDGDGNDGVLTATSTAARRQIGRGASRLPPLVVDNVVFYEPSVGDSVRTIGYSFELDGLRSTDVSIFSPHFFEGFDVVSWCYAQEPRSLIWAVRSDGKLLCFTWEQEQNVWGWTLCETDGLVKSVCAISENGEDRVYLVVERDIGGSTRTFVERMAPHLWSNVANANYLDCAVTGTFETASRSFTGLWHLEGRTDIAGLIDGISVSGLTVTDGTVTLPNDVPQGTKVTFGLPFTAEVTTLPVRYTGRAGSNLGKKEQPGELVIDLHETSELEYSTDGAEWWPMPQERGDYGEPNPLITERKVLDSDCTVGDRVQIWLRQTLPQPFTLTGVAIDVK